MKKLLAALLAISVTAALSGCNKPADEQLIDDITTEETFSETPQTSVETTEKITEETSAETTTEIVSDTKMPAEDIPESQPLFADYDGKKFPTGKWQDSYTYDFKCDEYGNITYNYYDENGTEIYNGSFKNYTESDHERISQNNSNIFEFDGEGHFQVLLYTSRVFGEYTFEDNMLTLIFDIEFNDETFINRFCFEASKNENGYRLEFVPSKSTEMIELPADTERVADVKRFANVECFAGLSALFDTFYIRKAFCIEYIGDADADSFKYYIEYISQAD